MNPVTVYVATVFPVLFIGIGRMLVRGWREGGGQ
jgi:hypothetical protein